MNNKPEKTNEIDLMGIWHIVLKRRWVVITFVLLTVTIAAIISFTSTPIYQATATILIENQRPAGLSIEELFSDRNYVSDFQGVYFNTQLELLHSRALGERVAKKLNLGSRPEFQQQQQTVTPMGIFRALKGFVTLRWLRSPKRPPSAASRAGAYEDLADERNAVMAAQVVGAVQVNVVERTGIVNVSYKSPNPGLAAEIVNTLAEEFYDYSIETRYEATQQASEFLSEQIAQLREDLAVKERELQKYGQEKNLMVLDSREDTVVGKFSEMNNSYTAAQITRVKKEAALKELRSLNVDTISNSQSVNSPTVNAILQNYIQTKNEYQEKLRTFRETYPEMQRIKARMDSQRSELQNEIKNAVAAAEGEYRTAVQEESSLKNLMENQKQTVLNTNSNKILYNALQIEVDNMRTLLAFLVNKQNETQVSARISGQRTSNVRVVDKALVPQSPVSPNVKRNIMMGLLLGLFLGLGLAFGVEFMDTSIKSPEDVEKLVGLPSLGIVPTFSVDGASGKNLYLDYYSYGQKDKVAPELKKDGKETPIELVNHYYPNLAVSEAYRTIRTSILFSHADREAFQVITFSSAFPQEGKSTTTTNISVSFAQLGDKVLLIDADLRRPRLHRIFKTRNVQGLSNVLTGRVPLKDAIQKTFVENLWLLPSGPVPPNPAELLNSARMRQVVGQLKETFNYVFIDSPPLLFVSDASILSSISDSTVIVLRPEKAHRKPFLTSITEIQRAKPNLIGVVFNDVNYKKSVYSYDKYKYHYHYRGKYSNAQADEDSRFSDE
jgi:succinoglycan biosynthesis transport protein ExoP